MNNNIQNNYGANPFIPRANDFTKSYYQPAITPPAFLNQPSPIMYPSSAILIASPDSIGAVMEVAHSQASSRLKKFIAHNIIYATGVCVEYTDTNHNVKVASTIAGTPIRYGFVGNIGNPDSAKSYLEPQQLPEWEYQNIVSVSKIWFVRDIPLVIDNEPKTHNELVSYIEACSSYNLSYLFQECNKLEKISTNAIVDEPVIKADFMFAGCGNLNTSITFPKTLTSCIGAFADCCKMDGVINFKSSNPNISGMFYGTNRSIFQNVNGLDMDKILHNFSHLIQPYTDLITAKAKFSGVNTSDIKRASGWDEEEESKIFNLNPEKLEAERNFDGTNSSPKVVVNIGKTPESDS